MPVSNIGIRTKVDCCFMVERNADKVCRSWLELSSQYNNMDNISTNTQWSHNMKLLVQWQFLNWNQKLHF